MSMLHVSCEWHEVEQTLTALELPPIPPASDPQRLLGYVLHILPRYTEMEMLATHLRLYASTLEQDMEQVKSHVQLLTREAACEREKKHFLERYAAQVVKERNDLLHSRGASKKKTTTAVSHFVWHNCCKKNTNHAMDLAPSIFAFRGEKLQEAAIQIENLQEEVRNQELLRKDLDFLLKRTQREHDSKIAGDRKHIQQLEKQIIQRAALHSNLEKKLYEVEAMLARHDESKREELRDVSHRLSETEACNIKLNKEVLSLHEQLNAITSDRNRLLDLLKETTEKKDIFARQIDKLTKKWQSLESEVEALQSEIVVLQTKDVSQIRLQYASTIDRLQKKNVASEKVLCQEVDRLKHMLKERDESQLQTFNAQRSTARVGLRHSLSGKICPIENIPIPGDEVHPSDDVLSDDCQVEVDGAFMSSSRSQPSVVHEYSDLSAAQLNISVSSSQGQSCLGLAKVRRNASDRLLAKSPSLISCQSCCSGVSKHADSWDLNEVSENLSISLKCHQTGADTTEDNLFDWEAFVDSVSECSSLSNEDSTCSTSANPKLIKFGTRKTHHKLRNEHIYPFEDRGESATVSDSPNFAQACLGEGEEEKESDIDGIPLRYEPHLHDENSVIIPNTTNHEQYNDTKERTEECVQVQNDLVRDITQMLNELEQKRKREENKASQAELALLEFQQGNRP
ncbi:uncharacterized protein PHALS_10870 [Plasmopara halstedii]|uniref:Uncharacterized protein n=1 Tax=Plasmopara halstedii TaxID=4781 RepID=A0A0P1AHS2_PLAHL|nr:uncharacterized protein PHALS_10870 [Plasmopara halstedii]CEG40685.1 hypothetical protein PHALS_10870 [Plasmopara halstedii]|eukprot:XP_024577054.1 hypothetical protein PHALS_10870 [Plasmopara halstedii]